MIRSAIFAPMPAPRIARQSSSAAHWQPRSAEAASKPSRRVEIVVAAPESPAHQSVQGAIDVTWEARVRFGEEIVTLRGA